MGCPRLMKRTKKQLFPCIKPLPEELLTEVFARVGSSSVIDLFNVKQSCKKFFNAGCDAEVLRRVSLEKFPTVPWMSSSEYYSFLRDCEEKGNPEALFKHGMVEYFSSKNKQESGMKFLKKAACLGHEEAAYILGLILLCTDHRLKAQAFDFLKIVEKESSTSSTNIQKCRKRLEKIIREMWTSRGSLPQPEPLCTSLVCKKNGLKSGWVSIEDEELSNCEDCRWDHEIVLLRNMLHAL
ncbi:hypothetical protein NE237_009640 [Protea cynaroides]|uniref:At2g35280-like TPR domain-containing protein n=1 Tax=Protea cynaroides TaxID=273540 RepID=A0A9Q0KY96_9MAGN|nr:hypothetical protein NE237_009640 [Protea cynaroides]